MSSNNFNFEKLNKLWGEFPEKFLHNIDIEEIGNTDAFHHILGRNKENKNLSSIFNSLPVVNAPHLQFHGKILKEKNVLLNIAATRIMERLKSLMRNDLMFNLKDFISEIDKNFILDNVECWDDDVWNELKLLLKE